MATSRNFKSPAAWRGWLERNHFTRREIVVRCFKVHAGERGIGYREALDEALCFGWIDGVRHAYDADSFLTRFTPRKAKSYWSQVNIKRARELEAEGRMHAAGLAAFEAREGVARAPYSFESRALELDRAFVRRLRANGNAWKHFQAEAPWYRRTTTFWIMSAKKPETRERRFSTLLECCARGTRIPGLPQTKQPRTPRIERRS